MKNILFTIFILCPTLLWADAWDNLTLEQAKQVQEFLKTDPYILDYCDCCSHDGEYATNVYLMKVLSTEIVQCDWNYEFYSLKAKVKTIAQLPYKKDGPNMKSAVLIQRDSSVMITMNYTWVYNKKAKKAGPIYTVIPYDAYGKQDLTKGYCKAFTKFPKPRRIKDKEYKKWYRKK